ncbi:SDR family NAD(P)-dependent oxidoreductase [Streptomyces microflavus]|nr:SDR family oxidoreductase [Streptomyces microflavus]MDX2977630.1 SDR family oxidoreductase [Streptomyces sp. NRRL_B-2249]WSS39118.1 SDR family oxidoreductase [Streptomyces microflavus]WST19628.1 SDR family oxidoreductase [Streptomyces microflavus]
MREELPGYTGKVVLVVGSSRGLGRRVAELMAAQGARVIINSASTAVDGRIVARSIKSAGGQASYIGADVSCEDQVAAMAELVREKFGRLDIVVHCAAGGPEARVMDATLPMFERTFSVNSYSLVTLARHLSPLMPAGSRFVYMSSMGAIRASHGYGVVGAAKAASEALIRSLALELAPSGITVNGLRTTAFPSLSLRYFSGSGDWLAMCDRESPLGPPPVEKVAETILLLCSSGADYITGQVLNVDGGWLTSVQRTASPEPGELIFGVNRHSSPQPGSGENAI